MEANSPIQKHILYHTWRNEVVRSMRENSRDYHRYGGRGIDMFLLWSTDFNKWLAYIKMLPNYKKCLLNSFKFTIDRVDNNYGYYPMNLRIVQMATQAFNRRTQSNNTSGMTGISQRKNRPGWYYELKIGNKRYRKGGFVSSQEAIDARNALLLLHKVDCAKTTYNIK